MSGLSGVSTHGVGHDLVKYLAEVAHFFGITIRVTSGYRSPDSQAEAMFNNWVHLDHGKVYKVTTLPAEDRIKLDQYWTTAHSPTANAQQKAKAKADFLELAKAKVGSKSMHTRGRAIDVSREHIDQKVYRAITMHLHDVREGKRTDIYHFESLHTVPPVDQATKAKWQAIKNGTHHTHPPPHPPHAVWC
jgi:uncharacterized protein YcbK (DUF882 family)